MCILLRLRQEFCDSPKWKNAISIMWQLLRKKLFWSFPLFKLKLASAATFLIWESWKKFYRKPDLDFWLYTKLTFHLQKFFNAVFLDREFLSEKTKKRVYRDTRLKWNFCGSLERYFFVWLASFCLVHTPNAWTLWIPQWVVIKTNDKTIW